MNVISKLDQILVELQSKRDEIQEEINKLPLSDYHWDKFHETVMNGLDNTLNLFEDFNNDYDEEQSENN